MFMQPSEWRKTFENKTESELEAMQVPPGLPLWYADMWRRDRNEAMAQSRSSQSAGGTHEGKEADEVETADDEAEDDQNVGGIPLAEKLAFEAALAVLENGGLPPPRKTGEPSQPRKIPKGNVAELLEQQIGMCAALIGTITEHVAHDPSDPSRYHLMDQVSTMLTSSAGAARVIGQLRGIAAETKQTFITKTEGKGAGGVPQS